MQYKIYKTLTTLIYNMFCIRFEEINFLYILEMKKLDRRYYVYSKYGSKGLFMMMNFYQI